MAPFLVKDASDEVVVVYREYAGAIPVSVMRKFVRYVRKQGEKGVYYPVDVMDVYGEAFAKLEARAANLPEGVESPVAYLTSASRLILLKIRQRVTVPAREEYRMIDGVKKPFERCDTACDQELDAACGDEERVSYDANELAEMLLAAPDALEMRRQAKECLETTFRMLAPETVRAFRCWIEADGVVAEAAKLMGEGRTTYMRRFGPRCAEFRLACTWRF